MCLDLLSSFSSDFRCGFDRSKSPHCVQNTLAALFLLKMRYLNFLFLNNVFGLN